MQSKEQVGVCHIADIVYYGLFTDRHSTTFNILVSRLYDKGFVTDSAIFFRISLIAKSL